MAAQDANAAALEQEVHVLVNQARAQGAQCGAQGAFAPQLALTGNSLLDCIARTQSHAMATQKFFDHTNPDGSVPDQRMTAAGYAWDNMGENIAAGLPTATATMTAWMQSDGHCANIMSPNFSQLGVGFYQTAEGASPFAYYWTQEFAHPAAP